MPVCLPLKPDAIIQLKDINRTNNGPVFVLLLAPGGNLRHGIFDNNKVTETHAKATLLRFLSAFEALHAKAFAIATPYEGNFR
jgi:serine/threonine protein kinase